MTIRLNKVTRDLNVGITTAVEFLQKKGFTVEANPNTKITDEQFEMLKKEFSTDKDLKIKSERFSQERQNKERNKASVSIEGYGNEEQEHAKVEEIKTVIPEDVRPKFKPVGKIDLDKLNHKHTEVSEPQEETAPQTEEPAEEKPAETPVATTPEPEAPATPEPVVTEPVSELKVQTPVEEETSAETFENGNITDSIHPPAISARNFYRIILLIICDRPHNLHTFDLPVNIHIIRTWIHASSTPELSRPYQILKTFPKRKNTRPFQLLPVLSTRFWFRGVRPRRIRTRATTKHRT